MSNFEIEIEITLREKNGYHSDRLEKVTHMLDAESIASLHADVVEQLGTVLWRGAMAQIVPAVKAAREAAEAEKRSNKERMEAAPDREPGEEG